MDAVTLRRAMQQTYVPDRTIAGYLPFFEAAMRAAEITTVRRAAAWCAELGHESAGLRAMTEDETSNPAWSWDRTHYRGRGPLQLTWLANYRRFGEWCLQQGYVDDAELFVNQPELVEQPRWGFLSASWYWLNAGPRPGQINAFADAGDILSVSRCVNGWVTTPNGMPDRLARWNNCLTLGTALLPTEEGDFDMAGEAKDVQEQLRGPGQTGWAAWLYHLAKDKQPKLSLVDFVREIHAKLVSRLPVTGDPNIARPVPPNQPDDLFGHVLSLRAEVAQLRKLVEDKLTGGK